MASADPLLSDLLLHPTRSQMEREKSRLGTESASYSTVLLEAFSTFEYKKGIDDLARSVEAPNKFGSQALAGYFQGSMSRLLLNW